MVVLLYSGVIKFSAVQAFLDGMDCLVLSARYLFDACMLVCSLKSFEGEGVSSAPLIVVLNQIVQL